MNDQQQAKPERSASFTPTRVTVQTGDLETCWRAGDDTAAATQVAILQDEIQQLRRYNSDLARLSESRHRNMVEARTIVTLVSEMRTAQRDYFRLRSPSVLSHAKQLEAKVDRELKEIHERAQQGRLF